MIRKAAILLILVASGPAAHTQVAELGVIGGVTYYIGDLNPTRHYPKKATTLAGGVLFRYNFNERYALRLQGIYGKLQADDANSSDSLQQLRNLHFRSNLFEAAALLEINFFKYRAGGKDKKNWTPFVFGGLAYFRANPRAQLNSTWFDLQPLGTEGQGGSGGPAPYKVDQMCIPFGAGMKFNFHRIDIQLEWGMRRTYTDHIDDVSGTYVDNDLLAFENGDLAAALADRSVLRDSGINTGRARGDSETWDWYQFTGVSITVLLGPRFTECEELYKSMKQRGR